MPYVLGTRPRFVLEGIGHGWRRDVTYQVRSDVRGRFEIGPMTVRVSDPFGLVELGRAFRTTVPLTVTPRTVPLPHDPARRRLDRVGRQPAAGLRDRQRRGRHRPRVPPRRRPAPGPLAQLGPGRRADGAPRGAALAVAGHALPRQPAPAPTAARASPPPSRPRSRPPPRSRSTSASAASRSGWSPPPARTRAAPGTTGEAELNTGPLLEALAVVQPLPRPRLDTGWLAEPAHGGLLVAVLGSLDDARPARCCAGCTHHAGVGPRGRPRRRRLARRRPPRRAAPAPRASRAGARSSLGPRDRLDTVWQELGAPHAQAASRGRVPPPRRWPMRRLTRMRALATMPARRARGRWRWQPRPPSRRHHAGWRLLAWQRLHRATRPATSARCFVLALLVVAGTGAVARWCAAPGAAGRARPAGARPALVVSTLRQRLAAAGRRRRWDRLLTAFEDAVDRRAAVRRPGPPRRPPDHPLLIARRLRLPAARRLPACTLRRVPLAGLPLLTIYSVPVSMLGGGVSWWIFARSPRSASC